MDYDHNPEFVPTFDLGEFHWTAARFVKMLIRARSRKDRPFLSHTELKRWKLENIDNETRTAGYLLDQAAKALGYLNRHFIPERGSGGIPQGGDTTVSRLIDKLAFLVSPEGDVPDLNSSLLNAAIRDRNGERINWLALVQWDQLKGIRDDLDKLPRQKKSNRSGVSHDSRLHFDDSSHSICLDGQEIQLTDPVAYFVFKAVANESGAFITGKAIQAQVPGHPGKNEVSTSVKNLPVTLRNCIMPRKSAGYCIHLPKKPANSSRSKPRKRS